jgi:acyl-[acyl-carrier-protein]-phospholipid O-acyltransferase/long-chain-fatty-acid--[acyl-carrier-protein] ligase
VAAFHLGYGVADLAILIVGYLICLLQLARASSGRQAFYLGLGAGFACVAPQLLCFWTIFGPGALSLWLVLAFWIGLFVALARLCLLRFPAWASALVIPLLWTGLEYFRSELYYLKFSWLNLGYAFASTPLQPLFNWFGIYGMGFLATAAAVGLSHDWSGARASMSSFTRRGLMAIRVAGVVIVLLFVQAYLAWRAPASVTKDLRVAGVQLEFPSGAEVTTALDKLLEAQPAAELLVLSEYTFDGVVPENVKRWCRTHARYLIVGGKAPALGGNFYDAAFVVAPSGEVVFEQGKSVPIQFFRDGLPAREQKLWHSPWGRIGICICYDLSYTRVTDRLIGLGAQALIVPTMDVAQWGKRQHELHARVAPVRAAEYGVSIFRVASSGISQLADRLGQIQASAGFPGQGEMVSGTLALAAHGSLPIDRWLAPAALLVTGLLAMWFLVQLVGGARAPRAPGSQAPSRVAAPRARPPGSASLFRVFRWFLRSFLRIMYRFRSYNEAVLDTPGPVLLLPNHVSWWDWVLIGVCLDEDWRFVTSSETAEVSWFHKLVMVNRRTFPVDMTSPFAVKHMAEYLQQGGRLVLFPEGRLSVTGSLMKLFDGTGFLIFKTGAKVVTAYLRGAERLPFSRSPSPKRWFPRISVHFSELLNPPLSQAAVGTSHISTTAARARLTDWLLDLMIRQRFETDMAFGPATVPAAIVKTARDLPGRAVLQDASMQSLTYRRLLMATDLLARQWRLVLHPEVQRVGLLLPNVNGFAPALLSLWAAGKTPAILNYSSGSAVVAACARLAELKQVVTSRAFLERIKLDPKVLAADGRELIFLEDVRLRISRGQKFAAWLRGRFAPPNFLPTAHADQTAVVLFTSGSEGDPKGVELTHRNLLANMRQVLAVIDILDADRFFNAMPLFHAFGLMAGLLLPLVRGVYVLLYPSPLHYRVIPSAFYNLNCTVFFGTNTFLAGYARKAHPQDFRSLRYVVAGAEKLQESTTELWMRKFGVRVLEGYGATECSPVLCLNVPSRPCPGSVGRFLPGVECKLEPVPGLDEPPDAGGSGTPESSATTGHPLSAGHVQVGRLLVRGPNIMRGYLNPSANAAFQALGGWYDTGDIVAMNPDGVVLVRGRLKRFAKVSGEMVSLPAVEDALAGAFPQFGLRFALAVLAKPDEAKGEKLVAVTNEPKLTLEAIRRALTERGFTNLSIPRELRQVHEMPRLGNGKVNYRELTKLI